MLHSGDLPRENEKVLAAEYMTEKIYPTGGWNVSFVEEGVLVPKCYT